MKHLFNRIVASTLVALSPAFATAQTWIPTKGVTFVVLVPPGSSSDLIPRMLSKKLPAKLGQPVIVDNRVGTSDLVGATSYASPCTCSPMNIAGEMRKRSTGTQLNHVPYRGVLPAVNAALAGELPTSIATSAAAIQRLNTDISAVLARSEFGDKLCGMGVQIPGSTSGVAAKAARDTYAHNQQVVKDLNITVEWATS